MCVNDLFQFCAVAVAVAVHTILDIFSCRRQKFSGVVWFYMTSRRPYCYPKTTKRRPCWFPKPVLWKLSFFLMQTLSFVPINLHRCWPREWKHSIVWTLPNSPSPDSLQTLFSNSAQTFHMTSAKHTAVLQSGHEPRQSSIPVYAVIMIINLCLTWM